MKQKLFLLWCLLLLIPSVAQAKIYLDVGQTQKITCNATAPAGGWITHVFYSLVNESDANYVTLCNFASEQYATITGVRGKADIKIEVTYCYTFVGSYDHRPHVGSASYYEYVTVRAGVTPTDINIVPSKASIKKGETIVLTARLTPSNAYLSDYGWGTISGLGRPYCFEWRSEGNKCYVTALKNTGTIYMVASTGDGKTYGTSVITATAGDVVAPTSLNLSAESVVMFVGDKKKLRYTMLPENATTKLTWTTDNADVATVDEDGTVKAVAEGETTVTATTANGIEAKAKVIVSHHSATAVSLSEKSLRLPIGKGHRLTYKLEPSDAKEVIQWRSSNERVAVIGESGDVLALTKGKAKVMIITEGGLSDTCEVTVSPNPSSLELPDHITFFEGRTIQMPVQIYPSDAYAQIAWSSSDEKVAQVDDRGQVSLLKSGTAVIQATAQNGVSASCLLTVKFPTNYLLLWLKDGRQEQYRLQTRPRITYADGQLWVHSSEVSIGYPAEEVRKYTIGGDAAIRVPTGISDVEASRSDDWCQMAKARPGSKILVYDVNGHLLTMGIVAQDGTYQYSLDAYPAGIYLIKTGTTTIKIIKR